ncbi:hypothetical protein DMUE_5776 [Dictyocoela muelleri]|nr:hypothetical protein DMUE_5776 [Dictyocoela muelleri]
MFIYLIRILTYTIEIMGPEGKLGLSDELSMVDGNYAKSFKIKHVKEGEDYFILIQSGNKFIDFVDKKLSLSETEKKWKISIISTDRFLIHSNGKCWKRSHKNGEVFLEDCPDNVDEDVDFYWKICLKLEPSDIK